VRRKWLRRAVVVLALVLVLAFVCDSRMAVRHYTVTDDQIGGSLRLVQISDLHSCVYGRSQEKLLEAVAQAAPDAVVLTGDIVDDEMPEEPAWTVVEALTREYPCFYVTGNHEWWSGEAERMCGQMEALGVTVLRGGQAELTVGAAAVTVCGIDDPDSGFAGQLEQAAGELEEEAFSILLAHRPERIGDYRQYPFDLVLSGHAHGGQWRIPGVLNGLYAPDQGLFPAYAGGRYDFDGVTMIVSRGLARESTLAPRIFNRPELVVIDLEQTQ